MQQTLYRLLPGVDQLLEEPRVEVLSAGLARSLVVTAIRRVLDELRQEIRASEEGGPAPDVNREAILARVEALARSLAMPSLRRVVNGTGVIIHTNLGRSPLAEEARRAVELVGRHYSNLEFDLAAGRRGSRYSHVEGLLCQLTGAEAGLVVNNNAAAVLVTLETLARGREVIISRGELVEIGGSFRIPDVMARSGAVMVEVGTTNKTHLRDYEQAIGERTAALLKVHQSNFHILGFTEEVPLPDLVRLAARSGLPVLEDLGSGSFIDFSVYGLRKEPTVQEAISAGAAVVTFSGDKLLGGPQAGVILGRKDFVDRIKANPLNRAVRIDKFTLAALEATLRLYLDEETALRRIPILGLIRETYQSLRSRASRLRQRLVLAAGEESVEIGLIDGASRIGGGALPFQELPTRLLALRPKAVSVNALEKFFLSRPVPIIGRIEEERLLLDVRTLDTEDTPILAKALAELAAGARG
jgi:L-seryl-tRNA(Ser) seleniumtransferase